MFKRIFSLSGLVALLIIASVAGIIYKNHAFGVPIFPEHDRDTWLVEARVSYQAHSKPVKVSLALPGVGETHPEKGQQISLEYGFSTTEENGHAVGTWEARSKSGRQLLYYRIVVDRSQLLYEFPLAEGEEMPAIPSVAEYADGSNNLTGGSKAMALRVIFKDARERSANDESYVKRIQEMIAEDSSNDAYLIIKRYYEKKVTQDWKRMLMIDLLREAGIACKKCTGVRLEEAASSREPVRLIQYFDRAEKLWRVTLPDGGSLENILVWSRSSSLLEVATGGGDPNSEVGFTAVEERAPSDVGDRLARAPWWIATISALPASERAPFRYAALIPIGVLAVVLLRNLVGLSTLGTFMPVLLSLAFLELPLMAALIMLSAMLFGGLVFRAVLSKFNLLVVPRVAACVVIVTLFMMAVSLVSYKLGAVDGLRVTVFPMIVLAWTIERMSLIWDEEGASSALLQILGSLIAAYAAYGMMQIEVLQYWVEFFPEVLLILLAIILLLGRYTGYRLLELIRFKNAAEMEL